MIVRDPGGGASDVEGDEFDGSVDAWARAPDAYATLGIDHT